MNVKSSLASLLKKRSKIIGVKTTTKMSKAFPSVLTEGYEGVWQKFLGTSIAKDLMKKYKDEGRYYVCAAFVSYISSIDKKCWRDVSVNIQELNMPISVSSAYNRMREFLHLKGFSTLRKFKEESRLDYGDIDFIRTIVDPVFSGYAIYTPRGRTTLDQFLESLVPTTFKHIPIELSKDNQLTTLLNNTSSKWWPLITEPELELYVGRANLNQLVFRYKVMPKAVAFYGDASPQLAGKFIQQFKESL